MELQKLGKDVGATIAITAGMTAMNVASTAIGAAMGRRDAFDAGGSPGEIFSVGKLIGNAALGTAVICPLPTYIATRYVSKNSGLLHPHAYTALYAGMIGTIGAWATAGAAASAGAGMLGHDVEAAGLAGLFGGFVVAGGTVVTLIGTIVGVEIANKYRRS